MAVYYFNYQSPGAPSLTNAAGTLISVLDYCLVSGMGWTKVFSGTNTATYRAPTGNRFYLGVDDTAGQSAKFRAYEVATQAGINDTNAQGQFPTIAQRTNGYYFWKNVGTTPGDWAFFSDGIMFYLSAYISTYDRGALFAFGDVISYSQNDFYNTIISGEIGADATQFCAQAVIYGSSASSFTNCRSIARPFTQLGAATYVEYMADASRSNTTALGYGGFPYPDPIRNTVNIGIIELMEQGKYFRGRMPGLYYPKHTSPFPSGTRLSGSGNLAGKQFVVRQVNTAASNGQMLFEISDTWRN